MGTNYYIAVDGQVPVDNVGEQAVHIGKSSLGWFFHFQGATHKTIAEWRDRLANLAPNETIQDEYGQEISPVAFWSLVDAKAETAIYNSRKYALEHAFDHPQRTYVADAMLTGDMWEDNEHTFSKYWFM